MKLYWNRLDIAPNTLFFIFGINNILVKPFLINPHGYNKTFYHIWYGNLLNNLPMPIVLHACACAMSRIIFTVHVVYMHNCRSSFVALRALNNKLYPRQTWDMTNVAYTCLCSECLMELSVCLRAEIKIEHVTISSEQCHDIYITFYL